MIQSVKVALAQTNPKTGNLEANLEQIVQDIDRAKKDNADIIIFPETAITGYCCGSMYEQEDFINYQKQMLEEIIAPKIPEDMVAVIGFVDHKGRRKNDGFYRTNSAAVIQDGKIIGTYDKNLLANDDHHEDRKYFIEGEESKIFEVELKGQKIKIGTPICEDAWYKHHKRDIVQEMKDKGADIILSPNQSYFYYGKQSVREDLFSSHAKEKNIPVISVNAVGIGDIVKNIMVYDGGSLAFDSQGNPVAKLKRFSRDYNVIDISLRKASDKVVKNKGQTKYEEIFDALTYATKEMFDVTNIPNAEVHVSGGIDSAIVAALAVNALGKDRVRLISNPSYCNGKETRSNAQYIADQLETRLYWDSIQKSYEAVVKSQTEAFGVEPSLTAKACIQAVLRTAHASGAGHTFKSANISTGNHTENILGWVTFHDVGSMGLYAPIADMTKLELYQFAPYINQRLGKEVIPKNLYNGTLKPAAELPDANEDPIDYFIMSGLCAEIIRKKKSINQLVEDFRNRTLTEDYFPADEKGNTVYDLYSSENFRDNAVKAYNRSRFSVFKTAQAAPGVLISPRSRGFSNRETIINGYEGWYDIEKIKAKYEE